MPNNIELVAGYGLTQQYYEGRQQYSSTSLITLKEFQNNVDKIDKETIDQILSGDKNCITREMVKIKPEIKIYHDIIPLLNTMMGIMKKQEEKIESLMD